MPVPRRAGVWSLLTERIRDGQAVMIEPAPTEQGCGEAGGVDDRQSQKATISLGMPTTRSGDLE
jgi:hypothetical protein